MSEGMHGRCLPLPLSPMIREQRIFYLLIGKVWASIEHVHVFIIKAAAAAAAVSGDGTRHSGAGDAGGRAKRQIVLELSSFNN